MTLRLFVLLALVSTALMASESAAKPKRADNQANEGNDNNNLPPGPPLPADLNQASLRVMALDTLYEFDVSADQLKALREAAAGTASRQDVPRLSKMPKLASALRSLQAALLAGVSDQQIATLRNQVADVVANSDNVQDTVQPTDAAIAAAPQASRIFNAGQIAAYLAAHADEVSDPVERMVNAVDQLRDAGGADSEEIIRTTAAEVGLLVAGMDGEKSRELSARVADWLRASRGPTGELSPGERSTLTENAREIVGDVPAIDVLNHWIQGQIAILLSNPQSRRAIDELIEARQNQ